jgi:hypothetical protein
MQINLGLLPPTFDIVQLGLLLPWPLFEAHLAHVHYAGHQCKQLGLFRFRELQKESQCFN